MKKLLAIAAVLVLLVAIIGTDWGFSSFLGDRGPRSISGEVGEPVASETIEPASGHGLGYLEAPALEGERFQVERGRASPGVRSAGGDGSVLVGLGISGGATAFSFIRSSQILGPGEPTERRRELLQAATGTVLRSLGGDVFIFDADATSQFGSPVLVFAREEFDLTRSVRSTYQSLVGGGADRLGTAKIGIRAGLRTPDLVE